MRAHVKADTSHSLMSTLALFIVKAGASSFLSSGQEVKSSSFLHGAASLLVWCRIGVLVPHRPSCYFLIGQNPINKRRNSAHDSKRTMECVRTSAHCASKQVDPMEMTRRPKKHMCLEPRDKDHEDFFIAKNWVTGHVIGDLRITGPLS
jgi:hypothetical protein